MPISTRSKLTEWLQRYLPAEILAITGAVLGGLLVDVIAQNPLLTALGATWGENIGFYGKIFYQDIKSRQEMDGGIKVFGVLKVLRGICIEFGAAEYFDSFLIRPIAMYYFPVLLGNLALGLVAGKLVADVTFYIPTIIAYEMKKKYIVE